MAAPLVEQKPKLIIDSREPHKLDIDCVYKELPCGDYLFCKNGKLLDVIIERKTYSDLLASIIDKRYNTQKCNMIVSGMTKKVYIIEANKVREKFNNMDSLQFITNVVKGLRKKFTVHETANYGESLKAITSYQMTNVTKYDIKNWISVTKHLIKNAKEIHLHTSMGYLKSLKVMKQYGDLKSLKNGKNNIKQIMMKNFQLKISDKDIHTLSQYFNILV